MLFYVLDRLAAVAASDTDLPPSSPPYGPPAGHAPQATPRPGARCGSSRSRPPGTITSCPAAKMRQPLGDTYVYAYPYNQRFLQEKSFAFLPWPLWPHRHFHQGMQSFMNRYLVKVGPDGEYFIPDIAASHQLRALQLPRVHARQGRQHHLCDRLTASSGDIEYNITDMAFFTSSMEVPITVFPCGSLTLFGLDTLEKLTTAQRPRRVDGQPSITTRTTSPSAVPYREARHARRRADRCRRVLLRPVQERRDGLPQARLPQRGAAPGKGSLRPSTSLTTAPSRPTSRPATPSPPARQRVVHFTSLAMLRAAELPRRLPPRLVRPLRRS